MSRIILPLIIFASGVPLFIFFTMPMMDKIREQKDEIARLDEVLVRAEQFETLREKLVGQYNNISKENLDKLDAILPTEVNAVRRALDIERLANESGLKLGGSIGGQQVEAVGRGRGVPRGDGSESPEEGPERFSFQIAVTGSYDGFIVFLGKLAQSLTLFNIDSLTFALNPNVGKDDTFQMVLTTYFLPQ